MSVCRHELGLEGSTPTPPVIPTLVDIWPTGPHADFHCPCALTLASCHNVAPGPQLQIPGAAHASKPISENRLQKLLQHNSFFTVFLFILAKNKDAGEEFWLQLC